MLKLNSYGGGQTLTPSTNVNLDNLSEQGEKHFLNKQQITNCILDIPQKIKLELNGGTLILKAGSEVTIPNGFEEDGVTPKFDYVTINTDIYRENWGGWDRTDLIWFRADDVYVYTSLPPAYCFSGEIAPTSFISDTAFWYDIKNNICKLTTDRGAAWLEARYSLPFGIITFTETAETGVKTIDQIFNGIGYIGSTIWVDKGVKCLIPNGRNEDGSLKNIEYETSNVNLKNDVTSVNAKAMSFYSAGVIGIGNGYNSYRSYSDRNTSIAYQYIEDENNTYVLDRNYVQPLCILANITCDGTKITSLKPKLPFIAADYQDAVKKSGDTMTGSLTVNMTGNSTLNVQNSSLAYTEIPSSNAGYGQFAILDKNGEWNALYGFEKYTEGRNIAKMQVKGVDGTQARINIVVASDGTSYATAPTPAVGDNSTKIATTAYCVNMRCTAKATTTSSASTTRPAWVVQNYVNGTSWYRVWSDGWKEQGGRAISSATVTFLKEFSNTNYTTNMQVVGFNNNGAVGPDVLSVASKTTKTMKMGTVTSQFTGHVFEWYACGY